MTLTAQEAVLLQETRDSAVRTEQRMESVEETVKDHDRVLFGNRHWGLVSRVRLMWGVLIVCGGAIALVVLERVLAGG